MATSIMDHQLPYHYHYDYHIHNLCDVPFIQDTISTVVTNLPYYVDSWIAETQHIHPHSLVGLDIEWRPSFDRNIKNPVATLQLCVGRRCLIFQIIHSPVIPESLVNFLASPFYTFVGVGIQNDVRKLREDNNLVVATTLDLGGLAAERYGVQELRNAGLKNLAQWVLGKEVIKPFYITTSNWDDPWLTPKQVQYACIDAFLSFEIGWTLLYGNQS